MILLPKSLKKQLRKLNRVTHRDAGYVISALVIIYCLSGLALNHLDEWNPDFIIEKTEIDIPGLLDTRRLSESDIALLSDKIGETEYKVIDHPTENQAKIYYDNATLHINTATGKGLYERISRRPVFYHSNVLHRNSLSGWKWVSDLLAITLILITITGLFISKGKHSLKRRGKWLVAAGALIPVIAWLIFAL